MLFSQCHSTGWHKRECNCVVLAFFTLRPFPLMVLMFYNQTTGARRLQYWGLWLRAKTKKTHQLWSRAQQRQQTITQDTWQQTRRSKSGINISSTWPYKQQKGRSERNWCSEMFSRRFLPHPFFFVHSFTFYGTTHAQRRQQQSVLTIHGCRRSAGREVLHSAG